jgi:nucleoside-diphosphate-sugar epimerase
LLKYIPKSLFKEVEIRFGDIQDEYFMEKLCRKQDTVFHLAALIGIPYSYIAPESYVYTNIQGTLNVLKSSIRCSVGRVVHTSTSEAYGTARYTPIDEEHALQGQSPYAASKIAADKLAESFYLSFGLPVVTIRPFNTFGPRQSLRAVLPTIIAQSLRDSRIKLGALEPVRDMNYITNTIDGFMLCATKSGIEGNVFNIGYGKGVSIADIVEKVGGFLGRKIIVKRDMERIRPEKSEVMELVCNYNKARKALGYDPKVTLDDGLKETVHFIKEHSEFYCRNDYIL